MDKLIILANFHVFVAAGKGPGGGDLPDRKVSYTKGMVVPLADVPQGQSAEDWIAKGLASLAE
jgi:hypothetical protein